MKSRFNHVPWIGTLFSVAFLPAAVGADAPASADARSRAERNEQLGRRYFEEI